MEESTKLKFHQLLAGAFKLHARRVFSGLEQYGISPGQPRILRTLIEDGDGRNQKDLSCDIDLQAATVGTTLAVMEKAGFIRREKDPQDLRALRVFVTPAGREAFLKSEAAFREAEIKGLEGFSAEEKAQFLAFLRRINRNLGA